jgi:hypothetical protein
MPLATFATCTQCAREIEISDLPTPLLERLTVGGRAICGRCGHHMAIVRLWPAVLSMPVTTERGRTMPRRGAA